MTPHTTDLHNLGGESINVWKVYTPFGVTSHHMGNPKLTKNFGFQKVYFIHPAWHRKISWIQQYDYMSIPGKNGGHHQKIDFAVRPPWNDVNKTI